MRKADYQTLAEIIRDHVNEAHDVADLNTRHFVLDMLAGMAQQFADRASVDKAAFLKACGIDP